MNFKREIDWQKLKKGKKIVEVGAHYRRLENGKRVKIKEHRRSTPN